MKLRAYLHTEKGGRDRNEDCGAYRIKPWKYSTFAVADGLGGHENGDVASNLAVKSVMRFFEEKPSLNAENIVEIMGKVDDAVCDGQSEQHSFYSMKTTLAAVFYKWGKVSFAHVGDSRIYLFRKNKCVYTTRDHSLIQLAVDAGKIDANELSTHPDRNQLLRAIGGDMHKPDVSTAVRLKRGDAILLCTDGFWERFDTQYMEDTLSICETPERWVELMLARAEKDGGFDDNNTALAVFVS